jgi:hypothetical protein
VITAALTGAINRPIRNAAEAVRPRPLNHNMRLEDFRLPATNKSTNILTFRPTNPMIVSISFTSWILHLS